MDKKILEDIIQTAKAAGADVKVVQIGSTEKEVDERPAVPLLKLELSIKKDEDGFSILSRGDWNALGALFLDMSPIGVDIEKVKEIFKPARNAFVHCSEKLDEYINQREGEFENEKERIRRKSC